MALHRGRRLLACFWQRHARVPGRVGRAPQGHADWRVIAASHVAYQRCLYEETGAEHSLFITPYALLLERRPAIMRKGEQGYGKVRV
jgi:hypothetical protein